MADAHFTADETAYRGVKKAIGRQRPRNWHWALVVMPSPMVGFGLYRAGETLTDLDGLDWCVNWVHKVLKK